MAPAFVAESLIVSVASVLISGLAIMPGLASDRRARGTDGWNGFVAGCFGAMAIRMAGTIALLVMCRYQMRATDQLLALMIGGNYVVLTVAEVYHLAQSVADVDGASTRIGGNLHRLVAADGEANSSIRHSSRNPNSNK